MHIYVRAALDLLTTLAAIVFGIFFVVLVEVVVTNMWSETAGDVAANAVVGLAMLYLFIDRVRTLRKNDPNKRG